MKLDPTEGGCWFCHEGGEDGWNFTFEWDSYFHMDCLYKALTPHLEDLVDREAVVVGREFCILNDDEIFYAFGRGFKSYEHYQKYINFKVKI